MAKMIVTWAIEIESDDAERAAMIALDVIRDTAGCGVQTFEVVEVDDDGEALGELRLNALAASGDKNRAARIGPGGRENLV